MSAFRGFSQVPTCLVRRYDFFTRPGQIRPKLDDVEIWVTISDPQSYCTEFDYFVVFKQYFCWGCTTSFLGDPGSRCFGRFQAECLCAWNRSAQQQGLFKGPVVLQSTHATWQIFDGAIFCVLGCFLTSWMRRFKQVVYPMPIKPSFSGDALYRIRPSKRHSFLQRLCAMRSGKSFRAWYTVDVYIARLWIMNIYI
jgi:hypothetical protein